MMKTSLELLVNQKVPDSHHILPDYSVTDPWPHLHQTEQTFDDREDQPQMQLKENQRNPFNCCLEINLKLKIRYR